MDLRADAELVGLARTGDKEAFGRLVVRYQPMAKGLAMGMVGNEHIAQELVQEAMLQSIPKEEGIVSVVEPPL